MLLDKQLPTHFFMFTSCRPTASRLGDQPYRLDVALNTKLLQVSVYGIQKMLQCFLSKGKKCPDASKAGIILFVNDAVYSLQRATYDRVESKSGCRR